MTLQSGSRVGAFCSAALLLTGAPAIAADERLVELVKQRDHVAVEAFVRRGGDVNDAQADGATALHWAVHWNDLQTANLLVRAGADVNATTDLGVTPLWLACRNGSAGMAEVLLNAGADPNATLRTDETVLMMASWTGNADVVRALLAHGADPNAKRAWNNQSALMWAASKGHSPIVSQLVTAGADVHTRTRDGYTPLHFAARSGDQESARILLAAGAKIDEPASDGSTALILATVRGHAELAAVLLDLGANPNADGTGYTALHWVAGSWTTELTGTKGIDTTRSHEWSALAGVPSGKLDLVKALLEHGADPNARLTKLPLLYGISQGTGIRRQLFIGATPFLLAAAAGAVDVMRVLADNGADPKRAAESGTTPLMVAAGMGRVLGESLVSEEETLTSVKLTLDLGNDVNAVNDSDDSALHGAAHIRSDALVQFLVDRGAAVNVKNKKGETPLMIAERTLQSGGKAVTGQRTSTGDLLRKLGAQQ